MRVFGRLAIVLGFNPQGLPDDVYYALQEMLPEFEEYREYLHRKFEGAKDETGLRKLADKIWTTFNE